MTLPKTDADLIQIVDAALADATRRAGHHLACRPGCSQCCVGSFAINALDAERLRLGAVELAQHDPQRFRRMVQRVDEYVTRTAEMFPGDLTTGILDSSPEGQASFEEFANDEVCPVLDPATGTCDLYAYRPMTCRVFGPPVRAAIDELDTDGPHADGLGVCELCFQDASPEEIAAAELIADPDGLEAILLEALQNSGRSGETSGGALGETVVAYALSTQSHS